jgi:hypothetical protein
VHCAVEETRLLPHRDVLQLEEAFICGEPGRWVGWPKERQLNRSVRHGEWEVILMSVNALC